MRENIRLSGVGCNPCMKENTQNALKEKTCLEFLFEHDCLLLVVVVQVMNVCHCKHSILSSLLFIHSIFNISSLLPFFDAHFVKRILFRSS